MHKNHNEISLHVTAMTYVLCLFVRDFLRGITALLLSLYQLYCQDVIIYEMNNCSNENSTNNICKLSSVLTSTLFVWYFHYWMSHDCAIRSNINGRTTSHSCSFSYYTTFHVIPIVKHVAPKGNAILKVRWLFDAYNCFLSDPRNKLVIPLLNKMWMFIATAIK